MATKTAKKAPPKTAAKAKPPARKAVPLKATGKPVTKSPPAKIPAKTPVKPAAGKTMSSMISKLVAKLPGKPAAKGTPEKMMLSKAAVAKAAAKVESAKAKTGKEKEEAAEKDGEGGADAPLPLLDLSDAAVKKMIKGAKKRGYVTYEQLNAVMPSEEVTSEQIEDTLSMLSEMGINVIEQEDADASDEDKEEDDDDEGGELGSLPTTWTDVAEVDPFVMMAVGRSPFRVVDLLELADLVERLRVADLKVTGL